MNLLTRDPKFRQEKHNYEGKETVKAQAEMT